MISHENFKEIKEYDEDTAEKTEFLQHPADSIITGSFAVRIQCSAKNSKMLIIECSQKIRNDAVRESVNDKNVQLLSLYVKPTDFIDSISCRCVAFSKTSNNSFYSNSATITKSYLGEEFRNEPMDEVAYEGDTVELRCDPPKGNPTPSVYWLKDDVKINTQTGSSRVKLSNDFSLLILVANKEDTGNYICVATNQMEIQFSHPAKLNVLDMSKKYMWSDWSEWSACSSNCKKSTQKRYRHCEIINKIAQKEKVSISMCGNEHSFEDRTCIDKECVQSQWSSWSKWSSCSNECKKYRHRYCQTNNGISNINKGGCIGRTEMIRNCSTTECAKRQETVDKIVKFNKLNFETTNPFDGLSISKTTLGFSIGIFSIIMLLMILMGCILITYLKRRRHKNTGISKSDLNIYYTCEKQLEDEECSLFKFTPFNKKKPKNIPPYENSSNYYDFSQIYMVNDMKTPTRIYANNLFGTNDSPNHTYHKPTGIKPNFSLRNSQITKQYQQIVQNNVNTFPYSNVVVNSNNLNFQNQFQPKMNENTPFEASNNSSTSSSLHSTNQHTPAISCITKTSTLSSSPSSSCYNEISKVYYHKTNFDLSSPVKTFLKSNETEKEETNEEIYEVPYHIETKLTDNKKIDSCDFINNSDLKKYNISPDDLCVSLVNSDGIKLSLDCGINLIVPEGAIASGQTATIYLGITRSKMSKPTLNAKSTLLSEVIFIGPQSLNLIKPVVLMMDHCINNIKDWSIKLLSNTTYHSENWNEEDSNTFINSTATNLFLMTENPGRFVFTGEALTPKNIPIAIKQFRLIVFYSTRITDNKFTMRVYCIDNLLVALQEVLNEEEKIGGYLLNASESFTMSYSNDFLAINLEDLMGHSLNCKYDVNKQELPLGHIWNRKNHLMHCSFTFEMNDAFDNHFNFKISASRLDSKNSKNFDISLNVGFNLSDLFNEKITHMLNKSLVLTKVWPETSKLKGFQNLVTEPYKMNKTVREKVCAFLDKQGYNEKNWRMLAEVLEINENLQYFASKTSPTDMILLYFEAVNELRLCEVDVLNYENTAQETRHLENLEQTLFCLSRTSPLYDSLFLRTCSFLDSLKIL